MQSLVHYLVAYLTLISSRNRIVLSVELSSGGKSELMHDCMSRKWSVGAASWCDNALQHLVTNNMMIKVLHFSGMDYWCLNFEPADLNFTPRVLSVKLMEQSQIVLNWTPQNAVYNYSRNSTYFNFEIGQTPATIVVAPQNNTLAVPTIESIEVNGQNVCEYFKELESDKLRGAMPRIPAGSQNRVKRSPHNQRTRRNIPNDPSYKFLKDCQNKRSTVQNTSWCKKVAISSNFFIVEPFELSGEKYWCINFEPNNVLKIDKPLDISIIVSSPYKSFSWIPDKASNASDARNTATDSIFYLGKERTTIEFSSYGDGLAVPDITSITLDGTDICDYYSRQLTDSFVTITQLEPAAPSTPIFQPPRASSPSYPKPISCGRRFEIENKISFGFDAKEGDWPWHAAIYYKHDNIKDYQCGGSLISESFILTAAHCLVLDNDVVPAERFLVKVGIFNLKTEGRYTQNLLVSTVIFHSEYNLETYENDIGLLKLKTKAHFNDNVNTICLPSPDFNVQGHVGHIAGWGQNEEYKLQTKMKQAQMSVISFINCLKTQRPHFSQYLTGTNFCAGNDNKTNVCRGDSGSGLVFFDKLGQWVVGGITSTGAALVVGMEQQCDLDKYVLFTDVAKYVSDGWFTKHMNS